MFSANLLICPQAIIDRSIESTRPEQTLRLLSFYKCQCLECKQLPNRKSQVNTALHQIEVATVAVVAALMCYLIKRDIRGLFCRFLSLQYILFNTADGN